MSVKLDLQSDYVQPSQACVNPLFAASSKEPQQPASKKPRGAAKVSVDSGIFSGFDAVQSTTEEDLLGLGGGVILKKPKKTQGLIRESGDRKTARVTLNDCLACSGCVTSAETVLIESQSVEKFKSLLESKGGVDGDGGDGHDGGDHGVRFVVSLSPESVASLAAHFDLSVSVTHAALSQYFKTLGVHTVCSTSGGTQVALIESACEFVERYRNRAPSQWSRPRDSVADSSVAMHCPKTGESMPVARIELYEKKLL